MQAEIVQYLKTQISPKGASEIAKALKTDTVNILRSMKKLLKFSEVGAIEIDRFEAKKRFNAKRRMRLYYLELDYSLYLILVIGWLQILHLQ